MKAIRYLGSGRHELAELPAPESPGPDDATVQVLRSGICGTDLKILAQPPGHFAVPGVVLGHEFVGRVLEVGERVAHVRPGDRVAVAPDQGCGVCRRCREGHPMACGDPLSLGMQQPGGLAEVAKVPASTLYPLPDGIDWSRACLIEPLSCVLEALKPAEVGPGDSAAVIGAGPMGLLTTCVLAARGVTPLMVFEPSATRRELAGRCGATHTGDGTVIELGRWSEATSDSAGPGLVVDAVGHLLPQSMELAAPRGMVIQLGYNAAAEVSVRPRLLNEKALTITSSDGSEFTFADAIDVCCDARIPFDEIVTGEFAIDDFDRALARLREGAEAKVLIRFGD